MSPEKSFPRLQSLAETLESARVDTEKLDAEDFAIRYNSYSVPSVLEETVASRFTIPHRSLYRTPFHIAEISNLLFRFLGDMYGVFPSHLENRLTIADHLNQAQTEKTQIGVSSHIDQALGIFLQNEFTSDTPTVQTAKIVYLQSLFRHAGYPLIEELFRINLLPELTSAHTNTLKMSETGKRMKRAMISQRIILPDTMKDEIIRIMFYTQEVVDIVQSDAPQSLAHLRHACAATSSLMRGWHEYIFRQKIEPCLEDARPHSPHEELILKWAITFATDLAKQNFIFSPPFLQKS